MEYSIVFLFPIGELERASAVFKFVESAFVEDEDEKIQAQHALPNDLCNVRVQILKYGPGSRYLSSMCMAVLVNTTFSQ